MTPLEIMAYAHCRARATPESDRAMGACEADGDCACVEHMRAALLALADAELPEPVTHAGHRAISGEDAPAYWQGKALQAFRAMCRAIAEDRG